MGYINLRSCMLLTSSCVDAAVLTVTMSALMTTSSSLSSPTVWICGTNEPKCGVFCAGPCLLPSRDRLDAPGPAHAAYHISDSVPSTDAHGSRGTATTNDDVRFPADHLYCPNAGIERKQTQPAHNAGTQSEVPTATAAINTAAA